MGAHNGGKDIENVFFAVGFGLLGFMMKMKEKVTVDLKVNGQKVCATVSVQTMLLTFLRDELKLTGTKNGCSTNHCGACMVLVNGEAVKSCGLPMRKLQDADILTIEGLSEGRQLHPIQAAFLSAGAVQCGFCTPGMIISTKALLEKNPNPTEEEIRMELRHNTCRRHFCIAARRKSAASCFSG